MNSHIYALLKNTREMQHYFSGKYFEGILFPVAGNLYGCPVKTTGFLIL